jgi:hypothetical protein
MTVGIAMIIPDKRYETIGLSVINLINNKGIQGIGEVTRIINAKLRKKTIKNAFLSILFVKSIK